MRLHAEFLRSAGALTDLPEGDTPEAAVLGRSNVGKSSLLNRVLESPLARVSRTPGRTRLLNLFGLSRPGRPAARGPELILVDCPGYGYAKVARTQWTQWGELMDAYLGERSQLRLCLLLVDAMLPPQAMDTDLRDWLRRRQRPAMVVATKWDRLSGNGRATARRRLDAAFQQPILPFSAITGEGGAELRKALAALAAPDAPEAPPAEAEQVASKRRFESIRQR